MNISGKIDFVIDKERKKFTYYAGEYINKADPVYKKLR